MGRRDDVKFRLLIVLLFLGCTFTATARDEASSKAEMLRMIERADRFTVFSLDPTDPGALPPEKTGPGIVRFHGYVVLGELTGDSAPTRERVRQALTASFREKHDGPRPECFEPRIGVRLTVAEIQRDVLLCFQCLRGVWLLENGDVSVALAAEAEAELNALLDERGIARDIPPKTSVDLPESPMTPTDAGEGEGIGGGVPEPEFWMLLFISWAVGAVPATAGGIALGFGVHRKSNLLKIVGVLFLLLGIAIVTPMTLLLGMWVLHWMTV